MSQASKGIPVLQGREDVKGEATHRFFVQRTGSGRKDFYDHSEFWWTVDQGGALVVHRRGVGNIEGSKVAAYAPNWWTTVEDEQP